MDPIEAAAVRDDMERLHMVSREAVVQAATAFVKVAEEAMRWRAEQARQALADGQAAAAAEAARFRAERDLAAATWDTRLRDRSWFADAPVEEILQTWVSAEVWSQTGDARAVAACERLRLEVRRLGVDPDLAQAAVSARDAQALTDLLDAPAAAQSESVGTEAAQGDRDDAPQDIGPGRTGPQSSVHPAGRRRQMSGTGQETLAGRDLQVMSDLITGAMRPAEATAILADPHWPRVAAQLDRAQTKIGEFNAANPDAAIDVPKMLSGLQFNRPAGELRTPAGWMIWQLHNRTAARGVQLAAQAHPDGHQVRARRDSAIRAARGHGRPARDTTNRRDTDRGGS